MLVRQLSESEAIRIDGPCVLMFDLSKARRPKILIDAARSVSIRRMTRTDAEERVLERIRAEQMEQAAAE